MKRNLFTILVIAIITVLLLSACAQPANTNVDVEEVPAVETQPEEPVVEEPVVEEPAVEEPEVEEPEPTDVVETPEDEASTEDDEQMIALISEKIEDCHMLNFILSKNKTAEEWSITIDRMIGKGADINPEEKELIINWLVTRN